MNNERLCKGGLTHFSSHHTKRTTSVDAPCEVFRESIVKRHKQEELQLYMWPFDIVLFPDQVAQNDLAITKVSPLGRPPCPATLDDKPPAISRSSSSK